MNKCILILALFVLSSFQVSVLSFTDMHVMKAAEGQVAIYTSRIAPGESSLYGFRQEDDLELVEIGKPYRTIEFNMEFYDDELRDTKNYLNIKNEWRVPVSVGGEPRTMLTVAGNSSNYKVTGMGDTLLVRELQPKSRGLNDSDEFYLLRVPAISADFFVHEANNSFADAEFLPLASAAKAIKTLGRIYNASYTLTEVQKMVKDELAYRAANPQEKPGKTTTKKAAEKKKTGN